MQIKLNAIVHVVTMQALSCIVSVVAIAGAPALDFNRPGNSRYTHTMKLDSMGVPRALYNISYSRPGLSAEQVARAFIQDNGGLLHVNDARSTLKSVSVQNVPGGSHIRFSQIFSGVPVYRADIVVSTDERNHIGMVINNFRNDISLTSTTPSITSREALRTAAASIHKRGRSIGKEDDAQLLVYQAENGKYHLAYRVSITTEDPAGDWEIFVDAHTGAVIHTEDMFVMYTEGRNPAAEGYVYLPDPLSASGHRYNDPGFSDNKDSDTDSLNRYRSLVQLDSLAFENGIYTLNGPWCTVTDVESPPDPPFFSAPNVEGFRFTRSQPGFEAVSVYYHISTAYRRLEQLGFSSDSLRHIRIDPHGFQGQDNSHYSPSGNWISFGTGGVDDAEDATTIWHEYGHAIQYAFDPDWGGGESGALGEGFGDYWAGSCARAVTHWLPADEQYNWIFTWDGHNPFWSGRILNSAGTYPFGTQEIHTAGQVWSSALMGIWGELGRDITDRLVLKSLLYLGYGATGPDNAQALLQADRDLYGGSHLPTLLYWLGTVKHFINPMDFELNIAHSPINDCENPGDSIAVRVEVDSHKGPPLNWIKVIWGRNGTFTDSLAMHPTQNMNDYECALPFAGTPTIFQYFILAKDEAGRTVSQPEGAPLDHYSFQAGIDSEPPAISHTAAQWLTIGNSGVKLRARISDNMQLDLAWIEYSLGNRATVETAKFVPIGGDMFEASITIASKFRHSQNLLSYRIYARDRSTRHNIAVAPVAGYYASQLIPGKGVILLVDDSNPALPLPGGSAHDKGMTAMDPSSGRTSASLSEYALGLSGYIVQRTAFAAFDTAQLSSCDVLILFGGPNPTPFDSPAKRSAIVSFVRQGGKVIVEGGEVGHYYRKVSLPDQEIDSSFRTTVLHTSTFVSNGETQKLTLDDPQHRIWNLPNAIRGPVLTRSTSTIVDQDVMSTDSADGGTCVIGRWSDDSRYGGIVIHSDGQSPNGSSTVYITFCISSISDTAIAGNVISNAVDLLLSPLSTPTSAARGPLQGPKEYSLTQNYPNPFNPSTQIQFSLPEESTVSLKVFNIAGQEVSTLVDVVSPAGLHTVTWDGTNTHRQHVSSGIYLYRLETKAINSGLRYVQVKKMILAK